MFFRAESGLGTPGRINPKYPGLPGTWSVDVRLIGPLWAPQIFQGVIDAASAETVEYGKNLIKSRTPVKTGNLQSQWFTTKTTIYNDEYYSNFVEYGTIFFDGYFMATDSTKEIEKYYLRAIGAQIGKQISSPVSRFLGVRK